MATLAHKNKLRDLAEQRKRLLAALHHRDVELVFSPYTVQLRQMVEAPYPAIAHAPSAFSATDSAPKGVDDHLPLTERRSIWRVRGKRFTEAYNNWLMVYNAAIMSWVASKLAYANRMRAKYLSLVGVIGLDKLNVVHAKRRFTHRIRAALPKPDEVIKVAKPLTGPEAEAANVMAEISVIERKVIQILNSSSSVAVDADLRPNKGEATVADRLIGDSNVFIAIDRDELDDCLNSQPLFDAWSDYEAQRTSLWHDALDVSRATGVNSLDYDASYVVVRKAKVRKGLELDRGWVFTRDGEFWVSDSLDDGVMSPVKESQLTATDIALGVRKGYIKLDESRSQRYEGLPKRNTYKWSDDVDMTMRTGYIDGQHLADPTLFYDRAYKRMQRTSAPISNKTKMGADELAGIRQAYRDRCDLYAASYSWGEAGRQMPEPYYDNKAETWRMITVSEYDEAQTHDPRY